MTAAAWLGLLPWAPPEERRMLLDSEHAAMLYADALRAAGLPLPGAFDNQALDVLAGVLAAVHGEPVELMEGRAIA